MAESRPPPRAKGEEENGGGCGSASSSSSMTTTTATTAMISAFRRPIEPHESLTGLCIKYNVSMADIRSVNNGLVNESTVHAKGWVMIPRSDRNGKKIEDECEKKSNAGSNAMDKLRKHYELPGTPGKDTDEKEKEKEEEEEEKNIEVIDTIRFEYEPAEKKGEYGKNETKTRRKEREESNTGLSVSHQQQENTALATDAGGGFGPSSMFARDKPLFTPHKEKPAAAADAITMEGVGIRAAMKYKSKTFFSKLKSKALHLTADLREEKRASSPNFRESLNDIRGPPPKGKGD